MSKTKPFVRIDAQFLVSSELLLLSPKAFRALVILAGWSAEWEHVGRIRIDLIGPLLRLGKRGVASLIEELSVTPNWRKDPFARVESGYLFLNEEFISFGRDGSAWSQRDVEKVLIRDGRVCRYCGSACFGDLSFDHVFPRSRGGGDNQLNLVVACISCNSRKGDRTPEEAEMKLLPVPTRNEQA